MFTSFHLLYLAMFTFVGSVICLHIVVYSTLGQCLFTLQVYFCWVCNMFTDFPLLYLAMFTFVGSVICLQAFIYSTLQCLNLLGL